MTDLSVWGVIACWVASGLTLAPASRADDKSARAVADGKEHWAFQPIVRPNLPAVSAREWSRNPIDALVFAKLHADDLRPSPPADPRTLVRRVYFDLIGLPPTPEEATAFADDWQRAERAGGRGADNIALARLVDRLLASPRYGERWARFWLDVVRYAETNGYERDGDKPFAWKYRDYVIAAFNADMPFDRFVEEQLAGDELPDATSSSRIATTFLRLGTWDDEPADPAIDRCDQLDDVLGTTTAAFLGLTLRCARCHDHKFEPLLQRDYYRVLASFTPLVRPQEGRADRPHPVAAPAVVAAWKRECLKYEATMADLDRQTKAARQAIRDRLVPPGKMFSVSERRIDQAANAGEQQRLAELAKLMAAAKAKRPADPEMGYVWREEPQKLPATHLLQRGDPATPGPVIEPGVPAVLQFVGYQRAEADSRTSKRRLALAKWLTRPENPLLARVIVNRLWQQHFGEGIVATENDFGVMGATATHPELLDWLAAEFISSGFRIKQLHRAMVLSNTYCQATGLATKPTADELAEREAAFGCWRSRRLPAEMIRDAMLAASGELNLKAGGPSVYPRLPQAVLDGQSRPGEGWNTSPPHEANRRSVYVFVKRSLALPELELLDAPDTTCSCEQRSSSTTGVQALTFLNGEFVHDRAAAFAQRLRRETPRDRPDRTIARAFALAYQRPATEQEIARCQRFLREQTATIAREMVAANPEAAADRALASLCLVLLNGNEFVHWN